MRTETWGGSGAPPAPRLGAGCRRGERVSAQGSPPLPWGVRLFYFQRPPTLPLAVAPAFLLCFWAWSMRLLRLVMSYF